MKEENTVEKEKQPCPSCTDWQMAYGKGGWYRTRWLLNFIPLGKEWVVCNTCDGKGEIEKYEK